jgi:predicted nucleotidyltransferase
MIERTQRTQSEARAIANRAASLLAIDERVLLVYLFGSAAHGAGASVRDIDIAILFDRAPAVDELMRLRAHLVAAIPAPIDLVSLNTASIVLRHEVTETGRCLFARTPEVETEFVTRTRSRYFDFKPYRETQWQLAGERLAARRGAQA